MTELVELQHWRCPWCKDYLPDSPRGTAIDHVIPRIYSERRLAGTAELVTPEAMLITRPPSESPPAASFISRNEAPHVDGDDAAVPAAPSGEGRFRAYIARHLDMLPAADAARLSAAITEGAQTGTARPRP